MIVVLIENSYSDGHSCEYEVQVPTPADTTPDGLEGWWEDEVWPHTGCGYGSDRDVESGYTATVLDAGGVPDLADGCKEWG